MKKVVYITGTRADFNLMLKPLLEINKHVDLTIIVTGMHLSEKWGKTVQEIEKYGFNKTEVDLELKDDSLGAMAQSLGLGILKITKILEELAPDLIFLEGDRGEALAGAIAGSHLNIRIIHHGGGDISDSIDNKIRNAISSFSDYHLTGNIESYNRLLRMGFPESNVFNVGEPGLDDIIAKNYTRKDEIVKKYEINNKEPLLLLIFHPNTKEFTNTKFQIIEILKAIQELRIPTIGLYANSDAGGKIINKTLDEFKKKLNFLRLYITFVREDFYGLMNVCSAMVGNSSAGITELPSFNKPFICVGTRQKGRLKAENVIDVDYNKDEIVNAIKKAIYDKNFKKILKKVKNPYGNGTAYLKITNIILKILEESK